MSLSNKLSISDLDLAGKRTLIRVSVHGIAEKVSDIHSDGLKIPGHLYRLHPQSFWGAATFQEFWVQHCAYQWHYHKAVMLRSAD